MYKKKSKNKRYDLKSVMERVNKKIDDRTDEYEEYSGYTSFGAYSLCYEPNDNLIYDPEITIK